MTHCLVMGIVNRTPDSFYDGGRMGLEESVDHSLKLVDEGAAILDLGAVKGGPGPDVPESEEADRLLPLVAELARRTDVDISVETGRPEVARRAIEAGATIVNDVTGLADPELATVCATTRTRLVLMHHGGQIRGRPRHPRYDDVVKEVADFFRATAETARTRGLTDADLIVDPGLDFGKNVWHSLELMRRLDELVDLGWPVLIAPSRKDVVGEALDLPLQERLEGTLALVALSALYGAAVVRVHDVAPAVRVVAMVESVTGTRAPSAPVRGLWD